MTLLPLHIAGSNCCTRKNGARTLTANRLSKSSTLVSSILADFETPALATRMSSRSPTMARTRLANVCGPSACRRSAPTLSALPPALRISATTASASCSLLLKCTNTCAPSFARARALARPIPREAPVTRAVFPESLFMIEISWKGAADVQATVSSDKNRETCRTKRAGSVSAVSAIDVQDMARDKSGFVRRNEHDAVGDFLRETETAQRNLRRQGRLVLCCAGEASQHASVGGAGCYGIHADSRLGGLQRHRLGDALDGVLGADIDRGESRALVPVGRGDIDDIAAPLGLHGAHFMLHAQDYAENIGLERRGKTFRRLVRERADHPFRGRVVHRDVETAEPRDGLVDQDADILLLAHVGVDELCLRTE